MRVFFEDYYGNDLCNFNINELINISQIKNLTECSIADVENDKKGNYIRIQIDNKLNN